MRQQFAVAAAAGLLVTAKECKPPYKAEISSLGCYIDNNGHRTLAGPSLVTAGNTPESCANSCGLAGYTYSGVEFGK